jgi:uncharacterized delta-60 repeat protein
MQIIKTLTGCKNILSKSFITLVLAFAIAMLGGVSRVYAAPGDLDTTFDPGTGANNLITQSIVQPNGKIIILGNFTTYGGVSRNRAALLNTDGSLDTTFNPGTGPDNAVDASALQADGKILIGGFFNTYNGISRKGIVRINADGSLDTTFNPGTGLFHPSSLYVKAITQQPDGKIIVSGDFTSYNSVSRNSIVRINTNGSIDNTFNPGTGFSGGISRRQRLQSDGKIIVSGDFTSYNGISRNRIVRINTDGSLDTTFNPGTGASNSIYDMEVQSDGKIIIIGVFTTYDGISRNGIARINTDGSLDTTFNPGTGFPSGTAFGVALQTNNKILVTGSFSSYGGISRNRIVRINTDGSLDTTFNPGTGLNGNATKLVIQPDGKIIITDSLFTTYNGINRKGIVRIFGDPSQIIEFSASTASSTNETTADNFPSLKVTGTFLGTETVQVAITGGTTIAGTDYTYTTPTTVTIPAGTYTNGTIAITAPALVQDALAEGNETITFTLQNPTNGLTIGDSNTDATTQTTHTYTITDDDWSVNYTAGSNGTLTGTTAQVITTGANSTSVTAVPNSGFVFTSWSDGITTATRNETNVIANKSVTANFSLTYTLNYTAGANGSLTGTMNQTVVSGGNGTSVSAVPNANYSFVNWSDGITTATRNETNVIANKSVTANFTINSYTVNYLSGANGSLTGNTAQVINHGGNATVVSAVANVGYVFDTWSDTSITSSKSVTNVVSNLSLTASFVADTDNDGVRDTLDICSNTTAGLLVGANGCPTVLGIVLASNNPANGGYTLSELTTLGLIGITASSLAQYEVSIAMAIPAPTTLTALQIVINDVNLGNADTDSDGVINSNDICPNTTAGLGIGTNGCPTIMSIVLKSQNPADGGYSVTDLTGIGLTSITTSSLAQYEAAIAVAATAPTTLAQLQAIVNNINMTNIVVTNIPVTSGGGGGGMLNQMQIMKAQEKSTATKPLLLQGERYLKSYIYPDTKNTKEDVLSLQNFLNEKQGENLALDGIYDAEDIAALKRYQTKYSSQILLPWGKDEATGRVGKTTTAKINLTMCQGEKNTPYFNTYLKQGDNSLEVVRLKDFLNLISAPTSGYPSKGLALSKVFDAKTAAKLKEFQSVYRETVLKPWGLKSATGRFYQTTRKASNLLSGFDEDKL